MGGGVPRRTSRRVIAAFDRTDMTDGQVAEIFKVGEATVHR